MKAIGSGSKLTARQLEILRFVSEYRTSNGFSPSMRNVAEHIEVASTKTIADHLTALIRKGVLKTVPGVARSMQPTQFGAALLAEAA